MGPGRGGLSEEAHLEAAAGHTRSRSTPESAGSPCELMWTTTVHGRPQVRVSKGRSAAVVAQEVFRTLRRSGANELREETLGTRETQLAMARFGEHDGEAVRQLPPRVGDVWPADPRGPRRR